mgnify:CR=1 FL=1
MTIRKFLIDICGIFLSVSLASSIEELIKGFTVQALVAFILIFFLSINFFFAKVKQLTEETEVISMAGFFLHISTLACFAAMPFAMNNFMAFMLIQVLLRISDVALILSHNAWKFKNVDKMETRWLLFDGSYFLIIVAFVVIDYLVKRQWLTILFLVGYLAMGVFEALFDFIINSGHYGLIDNLLDGEDAEEVAETE